MVVPVYLVTEDVVLSDDDGKQLSVRRSDLTPGENPGVQELGHPLCHLLTQQHYSMGKLSLFLARRQLETPYISHGYR